MFNFTSNSKIFVDFGATAGGSTGGAIWLQAITKFADTDESSVEVKKAIGVQGGAGFQRKQGGGKIMLTEIRQQSPQVRWRKAKRERKVFMVMAQDEDNGPRTKWLYVTVSKVDRSMSDEGEHTDEVELVYLQSPPV